MIALFDAQECIGLKPDFPVPHSHHGGDIAAAAANELFKVLTISKRHIYISGINS